LKPKIGIWFLILAVFSAWIATAHGGEPTPAVAVSKAHYSFPTVLEGEMVSHEFTLANNGNAELQIFEVKSD